MTDEEPKGFLVRCYRFFGLKPGQARRDFAAEVNGLTDPEKQDMTDEFNKANMPTILRPKP